jgi:four helix bundle protein
MRDYTKIEAWKLADDLTVEIYRITRKFPGDELYALTAQLRRASYSVPANIVEGSSRQSQKDYLHFLYISRGSLSEAHYFIHLAQRLGYIRLEETETLRALHKRTFACLHALIRAVELEAGKLRKATARVSSLLAMGFAHWSTTTMLT